MVEFDSPTAEYSRVFKILYMKAARKRMRGLPPKLAKSIRAKIRAVAADPQARNPNLKRLQASSGYRLRVGDWRVFYSLDAKARTLTIEGVEPRGGAYQ